MRVLAVTNMYPTATDRGSGTFVEQQIQGLRQIGLDVEVLLVERASKGREIYRGLDKLIASRIEEFQPNLIHSMYGGVMAEVVTRVVAEKPVVVSFCGTDLLGGSFFKLFKRLTVHLGVFASHLAAKRAQGIIVKSRNLMDALPKGTDLTKVWVIPNGIDLGRFRPLDRNESCRKLGWNADHFHVLFTDHGNRPRKRIELANAVTATLRRSGLAAELHQLSGVPHYEVPVWLNASDVVLLTSFHEGSPNVVKEALACNRPVVSTDVGDVRERIEGIEGCYIASPCAGDLAEKLKLVSNGVRSVNGRAQMKELSLDRIASRIADVYRPVVDRFSRVAARRSGSSVTADYQGVDRTV